MRIAGRCAGYIFRKGLLIIGVQNNAPHIAYFPRVAIILMPDIYFANAYLLAISATTHDIYLNKIWSRRGVELMWLPDKYSVCVGPCVDGPSLFYGWIYTGTYMK